MRGWLPALVLLLAACAAQRPPPPDVGPLRWPPPPDPARVVFLAHIAAREDLRPPARLARWAQGLNPSAARHPLFLQPYDLAAADGRVLVSDSAAGRLLLLDLAARRVLAIDGGGEPLRHPLGVALDRRGRIYVVDGSAAVVRVFDPWGHAFLRLGAGRLIRPRDVAVSPDGSRIYVTDAAGPGHDEHRVVVLDPGGRVLDVWGRRGRGAGEFNLPNQVAVAPDGRVVVLDAGNFRVQVFTPEGRPLLQFGQVGRAPGDLARPRGLAVDGEGRIYVSDGAFQNFQIFDPRGRLLLAVGSGGDGPGRFGLPAGIAVDPRGHIFVADPLLRRLSVFRLLPPGGLARNRRVQ